jgi:hypothetical protein
MTVNVISQSALEDLPQKRKLTSTGQGFRPLVDPQHEREKMPWKTKKEMGISKCRDSTCLSVYSLKKGKKLTHSLK